MILILPILVLNLEAVLCRSDFRIGLVTVLVSHIAIDTFCGLLIVAMIARCSIGKAYFVLFYIEGGRARNCLSCPIDYKILRGYFAMIDFSVVIGRRVPENHLVRGDGTSDFQIAADGRIPCGRDRFSRQPLHIFDIALVIHFDTAFDGGLSLLRVPCDTAGAFICFHDFIGICFGLIIKFDQIIGYALVFLDIVAIYSQFTDRRFSIRGFLCDGIRISLRPGIKHFQVFRNIICSALLDICAIFSYRTDAIGKIGIFRFPCRLFCLNGGGTITYFFL